MRIRSTINKIKGGFHLGIEIPRIPADYPKATCNPNA